MDPETAAWLFVAALLIAARRQSVESLIAELATLDAVTSASPHRFVGISALGKWN